MKYQIDTNPVQRPSRSMYLAWLLSPADQKVAVYRMTKICIILY